MNNLSSDFEEINNAQSDFNFSQKQRQKLNQEHRNKLAEYYDKIAIYSASAISFTVTLLGFLFNKKEILPIYKSLFLGFPVIYLIYTGWILLLTALITSLVSRKMDAFYVSAFGHVNYLEKGEKFESKRLNLIKKHPDLQLMDISASELPTWIKEKEDILKKIPNAIEQTKKQRDFYFLMLRVTRNISELGSLIGIGLIIAFSILSAQRMLFGF